MTFFKTYALESPSLDTLWSDLRSGDKSALEAIYRNFIQDLFNFGMSLHADETLVKDSIQDIFIDLWNYRSKLCTEANIKQYLFKSLSNRIHKELGKNARRTSIHWMVDQEELVDSTEDVLIQGQLASELSSKMKLALEKLPIRQKEVLQYLYFQKLSYEDTSKLLDINIRSTYTLAWKAINALKKSIISLSLLILSFLAL
ncbi:RNA polymerase sigma factor, sigma-70 family [Algoriphagus locisalis]|uniref:RNA polymerase sigma factor, sigma-70 family n=1 Tax=Algoriphagus locisalis TaxID=305507 RepID=A0A1I6YPV4_9BACT|nr:sigma-70 family RNA polymerase sigma factor [Algoriphagus locisalis]SFT52378.1 RNA polymerase sigma factor, sigma-70 family [Algoriphagus locisalis]